MFWAVELVSNRQTGRAFNTKADKIAGKSLVVDRIAAEMMRNGVFIQSWISHFVISPPLIITEEEIDIAVGALDRALEISDAEVDRNRS